MDTPNFDTMSDDDILNFDYAAMDVAAPTTEQEETPEESGSEMSDDQFMETSLEEFATNEKEETSEFTEEDTDSEEEFESNEEDSPTASEEEETNDEAEDETTEEEESDEDSTDSEEENADETEDKKEDSQNYKEMVDDLLSPFRANGRDMQVKDVAEAKRLMSMGANYNKKMQALNPHLKLIKTLENNDLLDENKLNFLIDLDKKDPEAINKLLKDSKIDPMEINLDESSDEYQPKNHTVSEKEVALDQVLEELQSTPTFAKTVNEVTKVWDDKSRELIKQKPEALTVINEHMANGVYDKVMSEVNRRQAIGTLHNGMSDLEAYYAVGNEMLKSGEFNEESPAPEQQVIQSEKKANKNTEIRKKRKQVASPTRGRKTRKPALTDYDPLNMSDEEIMKVTEKFGIR